MRWRQLVPKRLTSYTLRVGVFWSHRVGRWRGAGCLDGLPAEQVRRQERVEWRGRGALLVLVRPQAWETAAPAVLQHEIAKLTMDSLWMLPVWLAHYNLTILSITNVRLCCGLKGTICWRDNWARFMMLTLQYVLSHCNAKSLNKSSACLIALCYNLNKLKNLRNPRRRPSLICNFSYYSIQRVKPFYFIVWGSCEKNIIM